MSAPTVPVATGAAPARSDGYFSGVTMPARWQRGFEREARIYRRLWKGSVFSAFVGPLLFLAAMGLGLGGLVDEGAGEVEGFSYLVFVTPGLLAATAMQGAAGNSLWPIVGGMKWLRIFHGMVATPLNPADVLTGGLAFNCFRTMIQAAVFLVVATAMGGIDSPWAVFAIPAAALTALAFAAPLTAYSATQENDPNFPVIMRIFVLPLFLFSGTFFPVSQLPDWLQPLAWLSPLTHGVGLTRAATTGTGDPLVLLGDVVYLLAVALVGWVVAAHNFARKLAL
jgi:lipooligosaccharide transport system permease protein